MKKYIGHTQVPRPNYESQKMKSAMCHFFKPLLAILFFGMASTAIAKPTADIICSYAPSQSKLVASALGVAVGTGVTIEALATVLALKVVKHSSGASILSGSNGYIAGTIGGASAVPWIISVSLVVGVATVVVEIVCANSNHPEMVRKLVIAAKEVANRIDYTIDHSRATANKLTMKILPAANEASLKFKKVTNDIWANAAQINTSSISAFAGSILK